uniref:C2 domain-containing protein n=1 Tax=Romanomermis culicivorax TaxID=13658 RepID=A0A915K7L0_ROMCU
MPKVTSDGNCLGEFVPGLGPGQVVGRQVLASPCMGEIELRLVDKGGNIEVNVIRAKQLAKRPGAKCNADNRITSSLSAPYVKVYLMDGKHCIAKAKTAIAPRTADPKFDQLMLFTEPYKGKFLQISVWGDYGRMERRIFMGIALIKLDKLDLSKLIEGWYKLYHANSLVGTASPARKDSENSAAENSAAAVVVT